MMANCSDYNKGQWTPDEDRLLKQHIQLHGEGHWSTISKTAGLKRCGRSCRLRWMNHLRPNVKRGNISQDEEDLIIRLQKLLGNRWSLIAGRLPGRTDNEVKNYWYSRLKHVKAMRPSATNLAANLNYNIAKPLPKTIESAILKGTRRESLDLVPASTSNNIKLNNIEESKESPISRDGILSPSISRDGVLSYTIAPARNEENKESSISREEILSPSISISRDGILSRSISTDAILSSTVAPAYDELNLFECIFLQDFNYDHI